MVPLPDQLWELAQEALAAIADFDTVEDGLDLLFKVHRGLVLYRVDIMRVNVNNGICGRHFINVEGNLNRRSQIELSLALLEPHLPRDCLTYQLCTPAQGKPPVQYELDIERGSEKLPVMNTHSRKVILLCREG